jgi:hypothetical protein
MPNIVCLGDSSKIVFLSRVSRETTPAKCRLLLLETDVAPGLYYLVADAVTAIAKNEHIMQYSTDADRDAARSFTFQHRYDM